VLEADDELLLLDEVLPLDEALLLAEPLPPVDAPPVDAPPPVAPLPVVIDTPEPLTVVLEAPLPEAEDPPLLPQPPPTVNAVTASPDTSMNATERPGVASVDMRFSNVPGYPTPGPRTASSCGAVVPSTG
jgi:hypothetical protein